MDNEEKEEIAAHGFSFTDTSTTFTSIAVPAKEIWEVFHSVVHG